jgi:hypothetical protein
VKSAWALVGIFFLLLATPLFGQQDRIGSAIDNKRLVVLDITVRPLALAEHGDEGPVEASLKLPWMTLWFKRTQAQEDALARLLAEQQDSSSEIYHKWLTSEEYAKEFGLSPGDIERVAAWLENQGFTVEYRASDRDFISFSGTTDQVRNTFHTEIHRYTIRGESHYVNATPPSVPEALADVVLSLQGLTDVHLQPRIIRGKLAVTLRPNESNGDGTESLAPDDIATIYNIAPLYQQGINGAGQSIAVLSGSGIDLDDIRAFRSHYSLPGFDPQIIECCGADPGETVDDAELEADLDVEWTSAVARGARIILVYAQNPIDTVQYAVDHNVAPVISESFGICEAGALAMGLSFDTYRSLAQTASAKGMTWLDASGDSGAADCDSGNNSEASLGLAVEFPASIPEVTGVGGTEFNEGIGKYWSGTNGPDLGSALGYISEMAWNDTTQVGHLSASGGGPSSVFSKPSWQVGASVPADGMRDVPDVSLTASPIHDPYNVFTIAPSTGRDVQTVVGGTSASEPVFAGIVALLNQSLAQAGKGTAGNINPELYTLARTLGVFHDITTGNNTVPCSTGTPNCASGSYGYMAGPGYDLVTGLGSVDVYDMVTCWSSPSDHARFHPSGSGQDPRSCHSAIRTTTIAAASPDLIFTNGWTKIEAVVSPPNGRGMSIPAPTGTVTFSAGSTALGTIALASGVASLQVVGSQLPTGVDTINADYSGDATSYPSSGSIAVKVNAPISGVTFTANPNPIVSATGMGITTLSWNAPGHSQLMITAGSSTGTPLTGTVAATGSSQTGNSVTDGLQFFLVDLTSHSAIASVTLHVVLPTLPPVLTSISPQGAEAGSDSLTLQATGSNFTASSVVMLDGAKLATEFQNSGSLLATVPATDLGGVATIHVWVVTDGQVSAQLPFTVGSTPWLVNPMTTEAATNSCRVPVPTGTFQYADSGATVWFAVDGAIAGDVAGVQWYNSAGDLVASSTWGPLSSGGSPCFSNTYSFSGRCWAPEGTQEWKVVVTWNGKQFFTLPFSIFTFPSGYFDGIWSGTGSKTKGSMSMTVSGDKVTAYSVPDYSTIFFSGPYAGPIPICGNAFDEVYGFDFKGTFQSSTQASGTLEFSPFPSGVVTWTATRQ